MAGNNELAIHEISQEATIFHIPNYQRGYRWTKDEVLALLNDMFAFCRDADNVYCLQPLVLEKKRDGKTFVVDGQQRLTTLAIILRTLGVKLGWDIEYTTEENQRLSDLLNNPGSSINDYFRNGARETVEGWIKDRPERRNDLKQLLTGSLKGKSVVFLLHEIASGEDGRVVFQRLNAGKTPLTSSELIRALFMEAGNGLTDGEKVDIAKEWDLIESAMTDQQFWSIWNNRDFQGVPTRMDFLFSIVADVDSKKARQDGLLIYREMEGLIRTETLALPDKDKRIGLKKVWEKTLRCWWWMQSCYADEEVYYLLGWLALFTKRGARGLWELWTLKCRMDAFKQELRKIVVENIGRDFDSFRYDESGLDELRGLFVLLNSLEAQRRHIRFRFDLYLEGGNWDIEHIASQTDNPLTDKKDREEWFRLALNEMSEDEKHELDGCSTFDARWKKVWEMFPNEGIVGDDKHEIGNLALLDSHTNRAYKNAIFPAKRREILGRSLEEGGYIPPATEAAFAKSYSVAAAQMRYWGKEDADAYRKGMKELFDGFIKKVDGGAR